MIRPSGELLSFFLRGLTLASKFVLILYIARVLTVEELGTYGIFTAVLALFLYVTGIDFYTYSTRQLIGSPRHEWAPMIRDQFVLYFIVYCAIAPLIILVFYSGLLEWQYVGWLYLLLTLEHVSQEFYRLLVAMQAAVVANIALFIRSGTWVFVVIAVMHFQPQTRDLHTLFVWWSTGSALSLIIPIYLLSDLDWKVVLRTSINWRWLRRGVRTAIVFLIGTMAMRGVLTLDRVYLKVFSGDVAVGVYVFYFGIANALQAFVDAGIVVHIFPKMVSAFKSRDYAAFRKLSGRMFKNILFTLIAYVAGIIIFIGVVLDFVGKPVYGQHISVLWLLLAAFSVNCLAMVPHYKLYASHADRSLAAVSVGALIIMIISGAILVPRVGAYGSAIAILITTIFVYGAKHLAFAKLSRV